MSGTPADTDLHSYRLHGDRYVKGEVDYLDDIDSRDCLHIDFLRSPHAHARISGFELKDALSFPGVVEILTGSETAALIGNLECRTPVALTGIDRLLTLPCLPADYVRYHGEPVALVVATDKATAKMACQRIVVNYECLEPLLDIEAATRAGARAQHPDLRTNTVMSGEIKGGDAESALKSADKVIEGKVSIDRSSAIPLEPRGCIASWNRSTSRLEVRVATQQPHGFRTALARQLSLPEVDIHVVAPALGGAFGFKFVGLPEEPLTCLMALRLKRRVRWIESREEALLTGAREYQMKYRLGLRDDGRITGLAVELQGNIGALAATPGVLMPMVTAMTFPGPYDIEHFCVNWRAVMTNKGPWNGARGFGKEATCVLLEAALDDAARALQFDLLEIRRRNLLHSSQMPHATPSMTIDSGDYHKAIDIVADMAGYEGKSANPPMTFSTMKQGRGVAFELTPEGSDAGGTLSRGFETATVRIDTSGYITILTGVTSPGTGSETGIAQLVSARLGVSVCNIRVVQGDTDATPYGSGSFSSRAMISGGSAAWLAATELREKLLATASVVLDLPFESLELKEGYVRSSQSGRQMSIGELALKLRTLGGAVPGIADPQLEVTRTYAPGNVVPLRDANGRIQLYPTYSYSVVVADVDVDVDTGIIKVNELFAVHDCGTVINQGLVDAQFHGALVMGLGMAMTERERYDELGRPVDTTFKKYLLPRGKDVPQIHVGHLCTPSPFTLLGTKGAGESGVGAGAAAVVSAVRDAIKADARVALELPLTPERVLAAIDQVDQLKRDTLVEAVNS
ncbi:xanthine dehydrogenase family protein molybdopterin-binding subunit [Paraburkholderia caledonica]|uniref:Carbon-monoxide dehydrogenase large subunit n=1 Tax=Paraburkholderia caledonica TaxID=134536 RepID=A0ABU1KYX8_9BURK|nr:molybdopterin cofactor-binding domain-containing protein [Paraburkholderia caledonica]MDR6376123.1 carbon-monoxide dehydrogenase large subunit [Paraburkholderia caledonica]